MKTENTPMSNTHRAMSAFHATCYVMSVTSTPKPMPRGPTDDPEYLLFFLDARYHFPVVARLDPTPLPDHHPIVFFMPKLKFLVSNLNFDPFQKVMMPRS